MCPFNQCPRKHHLPTAKCRRATTPFRPFSRNLSRMRLRDGVPSLIVPGGVDQPFNAAQVLQRKAGLWIPRKHYTLKRAEQALKTLLHTPTYREHVQEIQFQTQREDGVATLCSVV